MQAIADMLKQNAHLKLDQCLSTEEVFYFICSQLIQWAYLDLIDLIRSVFKNESHREPVLFNG